MKLFRFLVDSIAFWLAYRMSNVFVPVYFILHRAYPESVYYVRRLDYIKHACNVHLW